MEPAEFENWAHEFRAQSKCLSSASCDDAGEVGAAVRTLHSALPKLGEASPLEQKCFLIVLQGLRNVAAVANHLLSGTDVMQLATDTIECAARMTISGVEGVPVAQSILKNVAQLLANLANGPHTGHAVFQAIWPDDLLKLALVNAPAAHEAACQTLYNCCRDNESTSSKVCTSGGRFLVRMLRNCLQLQHEATNAALALLVGRLVWTRGHISPLLTAMHDVLASEVALEAGGGPQQDSCTLDWSKLCNDSDDVNCPADTGQSMDVDKNDDTTQRDGIPGGSPMDLLVRSGETSCLLHLLTHEMVVSSSVLLGSLGPSIPATLGCLVGVLRHCLAACVDEREHITAADAGSCRTELEDRIGKGCRCCAALVLEASLRFFATLLSRDELANCEQDVKGVLCCDLGLPSMLLQALACLPKLVEPPAGTLDAAGASAQSLQEQIQGNQRIIAPKAVPYPGYRADLLAVIGNLAHGHTASQNAIAATGLELVLAQSHFSVTEPVAREWALWAVRNLCEGNAESQERVRNLKVKTIVQDEVLEMRSQQVEIDQLTGKLKLVDLVG